MTGTLLPLAAFLAGITAVVFGTGFTILIGGVIACIASFGYLHISLTRVE
ncbi:hypothetical protein [Virgibacillus ndiopensis]|nr:hypothetical protein [Virgibacillus ndiopensis]